MKIWQNSIFGEQSKATDEQVDDRSSASGKAATRPFSQVTIASGLDSSVAAADAMLIHRTLQKKLLYSGLSSAWLMDALLGILRNEMSIKSGELEASAASRDSLLMYFCGKNLGSCQ